MALERVGLGGVLTFDSSQAVRGTERARDAYGRFVRTNQPIPGLMNRIAQAARRTAQSLSRSAGQIGRGISQLAGAAQQAGMAMLPMTAVVGLGTERAASFEHQMSAVGAITNGSAQDMARLTEAARTAGIETAFSATQAGQAMEFMARSGASTTEIIGGLRGVVDAAAAEGIDLAQASDIVAQATRIMGREWSQASNTADILVRTAQRANTDVLQLGEALRYGGQSARSAGMDLEQTAAILGRLADAGLKGSTGGTALQNALGKLARPSRRAQQLMRSMGIEMTRTASGGVDLANISQQIARQLNAIDDPLQRTNIAVEIFGQRGRRAFEALTQAGEESVDSLEAELRRASEGAGAAADAAERRLDNFKGAVTLLISSLEGVAITIFGPMLEPLKEVVQGITTGLNKILLGVSAIMDAGSDLQKRYEALDTIVADSGENAAGVVVGIVAAIKDLQNAFNWIKTTVMELKQRLEEALGPEKIAWVTRIGILIGIAAAAVGPLLLGLGTIIALIASVGSGVIGALGSIIGAIGAPLLAIFAILAGAFLIIRNEGESVGETFTRIFGWIKTTALQVWNEGILPWYTGFKEAIMPAIEELGVVWNEIVATIRTTLSEMAANFEQFGGDTQISWREIGQVVGAVIGAIAMAVLRVVQVIIIAWRYAMNFYSSMTASIINNVIQTFRGIVNIVRTIYTALTQLWSGNIRQGLRTLGRAFLDFVLEPIKAVVRGIAAVVDAFGGSSLVSQNIRNWARAGAPVVRGAPVARAAPPAGGGSTMDFGGVSGAEVTGLAASGARRRGAAGAVDANIELSDERQIDVNNEVCVDGQQLAVASQRHRTEIGERSGFRSTPWQRRLRVEQGVEAPA